MTLLSPIVKKEIEVRSRSYILPAILTVVNSILFLVGLMGTFGLAARMRESMEIYYRSFLTVYVIVAMLEFLMIIFIAPLFTASAISGERETGTFDLLLTTNLTPTDIVLEKLISAFLSVGVIIMSCLPAMLIPLMFGGAGVLDTIVLLAAFLPGAFLMLAIGIFASSIGSSVTNSIAVSYAMTLVFTAGVFVLPLLTRSFAASYNNNFAYLITLDPLLPAIAVITGQIGEPEFIERVFLFLRLKADPGLTDNIVVISVILQTALAAGFTVLSVINVMPGRKLRYKKRRSKR